MVCFVVLKEACRGFSHIRNSEQLGPHKRIIYTGALKGKGKLLRICRMRINVHMKPPSHSQVCERHAHSIALLCPWAARCSTHTDNGRTWLDTSEHIAAVNLAVILSQRGLHWVRASFSGRLKVAVGGHWVWYDRFKGRQGLLCVPVALFSWSECKSERGPSGEARPVPSVFVRDSYTLEMLLITGQLRVTVGVVGDLRKSYCASKGVSGMTRLPSSSVAIKVFCLYHTDLETDLPIYW